MSEHKKRGRKRQTRCARGHRYKASGGSYQRKNGSRECAACSRDRRMRHYIKNFGTAKERKRNAEK